MSSGFLFLAAFLASAVEMVEALTIVLAAVVASLGPALTLVPIDALRLVVGALLLTFGLQWLRKAILRASGHKAHRDEGAAFLREAEKARAGGVSRQAGLDWYSFTIAFKGVLLEGLEVAFIVVTFGSTQGRLGLATAAAVTALVVVAGVGAFVHRPLARVPEN